MRGPQGSHETMIRRHTRDQVESWSVRFLKGVATARDWGPVRAEAL